MIITLPPSFTTTTTQQTTVDATDLPLTTTVLAYLRTEIGEGNHTYLTIASPSTLEVVKVFVQGGQLGWGRGEDGTSVSAHPRGSCVDARMTAALTKDLICGYNCCDGECPCEPVAVAGTASEVGKVGQAWQGNAVFSGDLPMVVTTSGAPAWMQVVIGPNFATLSGVPPVAGSYAVAVTATNCDGKIAAAVVNITVSA